jgi:hypothetical protein
MLYRGSMRVSLVDGIKAGYDMRAMKEKQPFFPLCCTRFVLDMRGCFDDVSVEGLLFSLGVSLEGWSLLFSSRVVGI